MKEQTRKELQQMMADYRQPAPEISWVELEKALALGKQTRQEAKTVKMWPRRIAVAAVALLVAGMGWQLLRQEQTEIPSKQHVVAKVSEGHVASAITAEKVKQGRGKVAVLNAKSVEPVLRSAVDDKKSHLTATVDNHAQVGDQQPTDQSQRAEQKQPAGQQRHQQVLYPSDLSRHSIRAKGRLTAKAYLANTMGGSNSYNSFPLLMSAGVYGDTNSDMNSVNDMPLYEQQPESEENIYYHQPIRFGLSLRYQLNDRWSVEGGLSYTYLTSDITYRSASFSYIAEQRLSYVGVPISASYRIWGNRHFGIYASAGTVIEKMVKGSRSTQVLTGNQTEPSQTEDLSIHPLQLSLTGTVGAEYNIGNTFGIYAEPGIAYHFDNHSAVPTYYQDKPLGFNLNIGIRFNLNK